MSSSNKRTWEGQCITERTRHAGAGDVKASQESLTLFARCLKWILYAIIGEPGSIREGEGVNGILSQSVCDREMRDHREALHTSGSEGNKNQ